MGRIVDEATIFVKGGKGGNGCESRTHLSEKKFIPTGGDGGAGGGVVMRADTNVESLKAFLYQRHFTAESGEPGSSNQKKGRKGLNLVMRVPLGTSVFLKEGHFLIRDLMHSGDEILLAKGGQGGVGNRGGKPAQRGKEGEAFEVLLCWRIPADIFLVGLPNAGKSKLLNRVTHAHARVEAYPFTTQEPQLGIYEAPDFTRFRLCELPGVYRESPEGHGVGVDFLKHLKRASLLLLVLDPVNPFAASIEEGHHILQEVLRRYDPSLTHLAKVLVVNKIDLPEAQERLKGENLPSSLPVFLISAETGEGIEALMEYLGSQGKASGD